MTSDRGGDRGWGSRFPSGGTVSDGCVGGASRACKAGAAFAVAPNGRTIAAEAILPAGKRGVWSLRRTVLSKPGNAWRDESPNYTPTTGMDFSSRRARFVEHK